MIISSRRKDLATWPHGIVLHLYILIEVSHRKLALLYTVGQDLTVERVIYNINVKVLWRLETGTNARLTKPYSSFESNTHKRFI